MSHSTELTYRGPDWIIPHFIVGSIEFVLCFCSLCYSLHIYRTYRSRKNGNSLSKSLQCLNFFGIVSFTLSSLVQCVNEYYYNTIYWKFSESQTISWYSTMILWSTGQFISYLLFLNRIKTSFKGSMYEPTKLTIYSLYLLLTIYVLTWTASNVIPFLLYISDTNIDRHQIYRVEFYISLPITITDILITTSMTYIFVSRLYNLVVTQTKMQYDELIKNRKNSFVVNLSPGNTTQESPKTRHKTYLRKYNAHDKMICVSVKITLLSVTSLLSSLILVSFQAAVYFVDVSNTLWDICDAFWLQIDTMISCLCLVLLLPKTKRGFNMFCCCCNTILAQCMDKFVHNSAIKMQNNFKRLSVNE